MNFSPSLMQSGMRGRMAMRGLRGLGQFDVGSGSFDIGMQNPTVTTTPSSSGVSTSAPGASGGFDWAGTVQTGLKAAASIFGTATQASVQKQQIEAQKAVATAQPGGMLPQYLSPSYVYGQAQQMPMAIPLVIAAAVIGFVLLKR
jgi:hypothetical protein